MSANCAGRHVCEPEWYPSGEGEHWTCSDCGRAHRSFEVRKESPDGAVWLKHVPEGTFGWTTRA